MPVALRPAIIPRERILTVGVQGTGKSKSLLDIARKCKGDTFHVMDNDYSYDRLMATDYQDVAEVGNVQVQNMDLDAWEDMLDWIKGVNGQMGRDDWLVMDSMTPTWDAVQGWFSEQIFGTDIAEYFLEVRKKKQESKEKKKTLGALDGWMDWPVINKQYAKLYSLLLNCHGHVYMTAELAKISDDDDKEVKGLFGPYGVKPKGQKALGHRAMTVMMLGKSRVGAYSMTTMKDRGRGEVEDMPVGDFCGDYLQKVAGWKIVKVDG